MISFIHSFIHSFVHKSSIMRRDKRDKKIQRKWLATVLLRLKKDDINQVSGQWFTKDWNFTYILHAEKSHIYILDTCLWTFYEKGTDHWRIKQSIWENCCHSISTSQWERTIMSKIALRYYHAELARITIQLECMTIISGNVNGKDGSLT